MVGRSQPPATGPAGSALSPRDSETASSGTPSASAAIWESTVRAPVPMSVAALDTTSLPSACSTALARANICIASHTPVAMPQPTHSVPSLRDRGSSGRWSQPNRFAPSS